MLKPYHQILCRSNCIPERPFSVAHGVSIITLLPVGHAQLHVGSFCQSFGCLTLQVKNCTFHPRPSEDCPTPKRIRGVNKHSLSFEPSGFLSQNGTFIISTSIATNANICQRIYICMRAWHPKHIQNICSAREKMLSHAEHMMPHVCKHMVWLSLSWWWYGLVQKFFLGRVAYCCHLIRCTRYKRFAGFLGAPVLRRLCELYRIMRYASGGYAVVLPGFGMVWVWGLVLEGSRQDLAQGALGCWCSCVVAFGYLLPKKVRTTNQTLFMTGRNCTNQKQNSAKKNVRTIVMRTCGPQALLLLNHQTGKLSSYGFGLQCLDWFCCDFKNESKDWLE